ncbi:protein phosphatase 1 regulatory subunit 12A [Biomphalaria pfeifferi]|uniref:Protein phosphatase 1 regulatory subunit 12A n=1 Tax=Biomphalaria pfeifferi TaxID=112525 RepID=A0AAD8F9N7_BIOPF|nr:protein phosphatase 1 regulatory subunit 12A [Biomphalaria pfeifferi]
MLNTSVAFLFLHLLLVSQWFSELILVLGEDVVTELAGIGEEELLVLLNPVSELRSHKRPNSDKLCLSSEFALASLCCRAW